MSNESGVKAHLRALLAHHEGALPSSSLWSADWSATAVAIGKCTGLPHDAALYDLFAMSVDAQLGISGGMVTAWEFAAQRQVPRILLVHGLDGEGQIDFDDIVLIANRILEEVLTPFLVLHDEDARPIGLIETRTGMVSDYSIEPARRYLADKELAELVSEFRDEAERQISEVGSDAFAQGRIGIALPIVERSRIGLAELNSILATLPTR